jgi:adenylyltransferase/sulfurtransferase
MSAQHRYHRQMLLPWIGESGQQRLRDAHALLVGCGALGSVIADSLARAGVGRLTIVDRDVVEITNLQRQVLFDEADVEAAVPKAIAAQSKLARINSEITVTACVDDFSHRNAERLLGDADVIVDGLDNFETRYLLNDLAVARERPYVYGGAVGVSGMSFVVLPGSSPCLRCVFPDAPPPGITPTCDTAGVLGPLVLTVGAHQATQTLKLLTGNTEALDRTLLSIDLWTNDTRRLDIDAARNPECPCCGRGEHPFLTGDGIRSTTTLCGRNAVQIAGGEGTIDLEELVSRLAAHGSFKTNGHLLHGRFEHERSAEGDPIQLTLFPNGRAIIVGTTEPDAARAIYARFIGA